MGTRKPSYLVYRRATLKLDPSEKTIEFIYPVNLGWNCTKCGACCKDGSKRERRILLLKNDVSRLEGWHSREEFTEPVKGLEPFVAEMMKIDGRCIFLSDDGCSAYHHRALLCWMYPFWIERLDDIFIIKVDDSCPGTCGKPLGVAFYSDLIERAISERGDI